MQSLHCRHPDPLQGNWIRATRNTSSARRLRSSKISDGQRSHPRYGADTKNQRVKADRAHVLVLNFHRDVDEAENVIDWRHQDIFPAKCKAKVELTPLSNAIAHDTRVVEAKKDSNSRIDSTATRDTGPGPD